MPNLIKLKQLDQTQLAAFVNELIDGTGLVYTANRALITDASGDVTTSSVTSTELGYLSGVSSAIQTQLNAKAASSHTHAASDITSGTIATARLGSGTANSSSFLRGDQTWSTVNLSDYLPLSGGTMTGTLVLGASYLTKFGGTSSSYPALKRNAAELQVRLADDSGYANIRTNRVNGDSNCYMELTNAGGVIISYGSGASEGQLVLAPTLIYNYGGSEVFRLSSNKISLNGGLGGGTLEITGHSTGQSLIYAKAVASHTADLVRLVDNSDVRLFSITAAGVIKTSSGNESTGAGTPLLGTNCPASTLTAPNTWLKHIKSDGTTLYVPAWA